jgi:hypothetical protein
MKFIETGHTWQRVPDDFTLLEQGSWRTADKKRFGAVRKIYLIVKRRSVLPLDGPVLAVYTLPEGTEIKYEEKVSIVTKRLDVISTSVQRTITSKLASELSTKLSAELGLFPLPISAKGSAEAQSKVASEFTEALTAQVSGTSSFEVTNLEEFTKSVTLKAPGKLSPPLRYYFFLPVYVCHWDIYLYRQETLEFTYQSKLLIWKERVDDRYSPEDLKMPLARVVFYEPQNDFPSLGTEPFEPDVPDGAKVTIEPLSEPCPSVRYEDAISLEDLAAAAFPATQEEKELGRAARAKMPKKKSHKDRFLDNLRLAGDEERTARGGAKKGGSSKAGLERRTWAAVDKSSGGARKGGVTARGPKSGSSAAKVSGRGGGARSGGGGRKGGGSKG